MPGQWSNYLAGWRSQLFALAKNVTDLQACASTVCPRGVGVTTSPGCPRWFKPSWHFGHACPIACVGVGHLVGYAREEERLHGRRRRRCAVQLPPSSSVVLWSQGGCEHGACSRTAILLQTSLEMMLEELLRQRELEQEHRGPSPPLFASPTSAFPPAPAWGLGCQHLPEPTQSFPVYFV